MPDDGEADRAAATSGRGERRDRRFALAAGALIAAVVALRLVALSSDSYLRLDWSAGLLTDEGFYIHNARNVALFGHARTDGFNNMLLSPLLHYLQVAVFTVLGVGVRQARLISVGCSLITLATLYCALNRGFGRRVSLTAVLFLGLDHTNLLYSRMALMDTPAAMPAALAFYAFVRAMEAPERRGRWGWLAACGVFGGITVVGRTLCAYLLPAPFAALRVRRGEGGTVAGDWLAVGGPLLLVGLLYVGLWYIPHRVEIAPMNHYYRVHQVQPESLRHLFENVKHALFGDYRGLSPYLFRHTPVVFALAILGIGYGGKIQRDDESSVLPAAAAARAYLAAWLLLGWAMLAVISYSPSRYYVSTYPAMAALAAIGLWRVPALWERRGELKYRAAIAALCAFLGFHAALAFVHYGGVLTQGATTASLALAPIAAGVAAWLLLGGRAVRRYAPAALLGVWAACNGWWMLDWAMHIRYTQVEMSRWLGSHLPENGVLIGDVAPGLTMDNRLVAVHVQPGLVNDQRPVEAFAGRPTYLAILDGRWKERYWLDAYSMLVAPTRRMHITRVMRWDIGVYAVEPQGRDGR